jgi:hypothetical protein
MLHQHACCLLCIRHAGDLAALHTAQQQFISRVTQAEVSTSQARVQELQHRLADLDRLADVDKQTLQRQVHNLQNLLLLLKVPTNGPEASSPGRSMDQLDLLRDDQIELCGATDAMSKGLETLCAHRSQEAEALEV